MFRSLDSVDRWVERHGVAALRRALAEGTVAYPISSGVAKEWLALHDLEQASQHQAEQLAVDRRAAQAAERAARYAMWSALISAAVGVVAAGTFFYTFVIR